MWIRSVQRSAPQRERHAHALPRLALHLGVVAAPWRACSSALPRHGRRARHGHPRLGLLQPGQPRAEAGGLARGGAASRTGSRCAGCRAWARTRRSSSSMPAASISARPPVPPPCSAKINGNPIETVWVYSKPEWTALVTRPDTGIAKRRGPEGQADRGHQGHRSLHLPPARPGRARPERRTTSASSCCSTTRAGSRSSAATSTPGPASTR